MTEPDQPAVERIPEAPDLPHRLGRSINHDPRSRAFAFAVDAAPVLQSVYWPRAVPIFDQGNLGSCTGNAAAGWLATTNALRPGMDMLEQAGHPLVDEALAVSIYSRATEIDPFPGDYPPEDTGSDGLSVVKVLKERGWVDSYQHAFSVSAVLAALMTGPVLVGTVWYSGMFDPINDGVINGVVEISGEVVGGHEYLLIGYDVDTRLVTFANSWGAGWAEQGYAHMTVETLTRLLADDGDATIPHAAVAAPAPDPGAASFPVDLDPDVGPHVHRLATAKGITDSAWVNNRLRKYFD